MQGSNLHELFKTENVYHVYALWVTVTLPILLCTVGAFFCIEHWKELLHCRFQQPERNCKIIIAFCLICHSSTFCMTAKRFSSAAQIPKETCVRYSKIYFVQMQCYLFGRAQGTKQRTTAAAVGRAIAMLGGTLELISGVGEYKGVPSHNAGKHRGDPALGDLKYLLMTALQPPGGGEGLLVSSSPQ